MQPFCTTTGDCGAPECGPCTSGVCMGYVAQQAMVDSCNPDDYAKAAVPIALLPGNATALINAFPQSPSTGTPTSAALWGAIEFCQKWQKANPTHVVVDVLATDGMPSECDPQGIGNSTDAPATSYATASSVAAIAAYGYQGSPKVVTYVIGVGDQVPSLDT